MHRIVGHSKCSAFHGHRYVAELAVTARLDAVGMVLDFGLVRQKVGAWIDSNWDHTAILAADDREPASEAIRAANAALGRPVFETSLPPTAESLVIILADVAQKLLSPHSVRVTHLRLWETPNCSAFWRDPGAQPVI